MYKKIKKVISRTRFVELRRAVIDNDANQHVAKHINSGNHSVSDWLRILLLLTKGYKLFLTYKIRIFLYINIACI
jgi:hypothetical protein